MRPSLSRCAGAVRPRPGSEQRDPWRALATAAARLNYRLPRRRSGQPKIGQIGYLLTSSYQPDSADLMTAFCARILAPVGELVALPEGVLRR